MMIRILTALAGAVSAGTVAAVEVAGTASPSTAFAWSALAGVAGAGVTYGVLTGKVNSAHARITEEKQNRTAAVSELKGDVVRGFEGIERRLEEQTRTVLEALRGQK